MYIDGSNSSTGDTEPVMAVIDRLLSLDATIMLDDLHVEETYVCLACSAPRRKACSVLGCLVVMENVFLDLALLQRALVLRFEEVGIRVPTRIIGLLLMGLHDSQYVLSRRDARPLVNDYQRLYRGSKERHPIEARQTIVGTRYQCDICVEAFAWHPMYIPLL